MTLKDNVRFTIALLIFFNIWNAQVLGFYWATTTTTTTPVQIVELDKIPAEEDQGNIHMLYLHS